MSGRGPEDTLNEGTPPSIAAIDDYLGVSRGMSVARTFSCGSHRQAQHGTGRLRCSIRGD